MQSMYIVVCKIYREKWNSGIEVSGMDFEESGISQRGV